MAANHAEIGRVGKMEADFQQYCYETLVIKNQQRKLKNISIEK